MLGFLDEMVAAQFIAATYGLSSNDPSLSKTLLSHLWDDEVSLQADADCEDEVDYTLDMFLHDRPRMQEANHKGKCRSPAEPDTAFKLEENLSRIKDMPLEIVFEILVYLQPADLLAISRTTRGLRAILMHKDSRFVWRASLANVRGLPSCPPDMTEPQFASLVFNPVCQFCGKGRVHDVFWACRVRCCTDCVKNQFLTEEELRFQYSEELPIDKLACIFPYIVVNQYHPKQPSRVLYYRPIAMRYLSELKKAIASKDAEGLDAWMQSRKENQIERIKHASLCEHWYNHWVVRSVPRSSDIPLFDLAVTAVLSSALIYLWKDRIFG